MNDVGGLIGSAEFSEIRRCYATGRVSGDESVGGLLGLEQASTYEICQGKDYPRLLWEGTMRE